MSDEEVRTQEGEEVKRVQGQIFLSALILALFGLLVAAGGSLFGLSDGDCLQLGLLSSMAVGLLRLLWLVPEME